MSVLRELDREANRRAELEHAQRAVEALKSSKGWKRWLGLRRHFHRYSFANQLLIALQKPDASRVAGFRTWLKLGYCVKRGERALCRFCSASAMASCRVPSATHMTRRFSMRLASLGSVLSATDQEVLPCR